ncbi:hypothetical protein SKM54_08770 [Acinetobacter faecalis]|uniref:hypothetical protein n=1 Tax=Acinetobacter faecalis TaxID=2665161 RepID=UPI002A919C25|nr:hypothetical protein [Acinetobacter faecalis]MDY6482534.1 hypothetical protein [Acinetobacter faecalis]
MSKTIDGFSLDLPPNKAQIIGLAQLHRKQLDEAIYHNELRIGDFCLAQKKRVYDYTRELNAEQRAEFYQAYNGELERLSVDESPHHHEEENQTHVKIMYGVLAVIAIVLYFVFLAPVLH